MFCLSEQFGATSVRGATAVAMQNELSMYVVIHLKASRRQAGLPWGFGFRPLDYFNFALCLDSCLGPDMP